MEDSLVSDKTESNENDAAKLSQRSNKNEKTTARIVADGYKTDILTKITP
jgi:hypothetical protein